MMASGSAWSSPIAVYVQRRGRVINNKADRYAYAYGWPVSEVRDGRNNVLETYTHGPDLSGTLGGAGGIGSILSVTDHQPQTTHHFFHYDANGNVVRLTDADREIVSSLEYGPFGTVLLKSGSYTPRYQFSTKEFDAAVGLNYYGYRYYDAPTGRWLSPDPLGDQAFYRLYVRGKSARQQRELKRSALIPPYLFVLNNPVTFVDVYGLNLWDSVVTKGKEFCCMVGVLGLDGAINLKNLADQVDEVARNDYPDPADALTKVNALKHCFGSCALKKLYGEDAARKLSDCHETHDVYQDPQDRATDEFNNNVGYGFADAGLNCYDACKAAVDRDDGTLDLDPYH